MSVKRLQVMGVKKNLECMNLLLSYFIYSLAIRPQKRQRRLELYEMQLEETASCL